MLVEIVKRGTQLNIPNPVRTTASSKTKCTAQEERAVKSRATTNSVRSNTPERGTDSKPHEQSNSCETGLGLGKAELFRQRSQGQGHTLQPKTAILVSTRFQSQKQKYSLIGSPPKAAENKQFPLIPTHPNILDGLVDHFGFSCTESEHIIQSSRGIS